MSKITCKCGNVLHDQTDRIRCKGYVISDQEFFNMLDLADEMIESENPDREEAAMTFRRNIGGYIQLRHIFQCNACGRIMFEDASGAFQSFFPEDACQNNLLDYGVQGEIRYMLKKK